MYGFIYLTENLVDGKKYIGQKKWDKKANKYLGSGIYLTKAIKKYGRDNFKRIIIEECKTKEELDNREIYWIDFYDAVAREDFYNIAKGGDGGDVISGYTEEQRKDLSDKLSKMRKGKSNLGANNPNATKIILLNTMEVFSTIVEASEVYDISKDRIQQCCSARKNGKNWSAGVLPDESMGVWEYYDESKNYEYIPFKIDYSTRTKKVICLTTGEIFNSTKEALEKHPTACIAGIQGCCNKRKSYNTSGYLVDTGERLRWAYLD